MIYASEVIEHVADRGLFIRAIASMLDPKGAVIVTTINRSLPALLLAKFALEYVFQLIPAGTHDPRKFVRPKELREEFAATGIILDDMVGLAPRPGGGFTQTGSLAINYAASGGFMLTDCDHAPPQRIGQWSDGTHGMSNISMPSSLSDSRSSCVACP